MKTGPWKQHDPFENDADGPRQVLQASVVACVAIVGLCCMILIAAQHATRIGRYEQAVILFCGGAFTAWRLMRQLPIHLELVRRARDHRRWRMLVGALALNLLMVAVWVGVVAYVLILAGSVG